MISDLQPYACGTNVPQDKFSALTIATGGSPVQPIADVPAYLATRMPQPEIEGEEPLLITLPAVVQSEVKALVRACKFTAGLVKEDKWSVQRACVEALRVYRKWLWNLKTFRAKFDLWVVKRDWLVLVNRAKAPACWRAEGAGLPDAFLAFVSMRYGQFKRSTDGKRQAIFSVLRQWKTGKNQEGDAQPIPGYEAEWPNRQTNFVPVGWSESNIRRQVKKFGKTTVPVLALLHDSQSAARQHLPQVLGTRKGLRFLEKITFDDVRTDWLIFNPKTGQAEEMWVLVARDEATAMVLGFVMLPATVREDGKATHLGARQMKELAGYLLQTYPLPPYVMHWVVERGTATLAEGVKAALGELFNNRIKVHYTSMIGDQSPRGYKEKAKGNSRGKASHESHNRLFHTQGAFIGGQTGNRWDVRPAELNARCNESREIYLRSQDLPEHLRDQVKYPLPTPALARDLFRQFCTDQNFRTAHTLEDFEDVLEWFDGTKWQPVGVQASACPAGAKLRKRKEMPVERAMRLIRLVPKWDRCSPDIIKTFLEHTERRVEVEANGEIKFSHEGKLLTFACPQPQTPDPRPQTLSLPPGTKCLAYHHPDDPQFLHLTSGDGRILGTWYQRSRVGYQDQEALAQAMRYTHAARTVAMDTARELAAPEIAGLEAMRASNAALEQFIVTADVPTASGTETGNRIGTVLATTKAAINQQKKAEDKFIRETGGSAASDILAKPETTDESGREIGDDFLSAITGKQ